MESYSICEWLWDKMKRPLHLYDTWGAMYCPRVRERVSRPGGGGVISIMLFRILEKVVACLIMRLRSRVN